MLLAQLEEQLRQCCPNLVLRSMEPMSRHTSFRIGGPVTLMALPHTKEEAATVLQHAKEGGIEPLFLGKGSNLLVSDAGISGFAVKYSGDGYGQGQAPHTIWAEAGCSLAQVAVYAMEQGLSGLEFAHGIPGSLGGAVFMNAGAYDGEMAQVVTKVEAMAPDGTLAVFYPKDLEFGYRHSVFSQKPYLIVRAELQLTPKSKEEIQGTMADLMERRRSKQPLEFPSAGSTFKRPPGQFAGGLIEACGLKGAQVGGAQVSEKHAGFVINRGGATCEDVVTLMKQVRDCVQQEKGVTLEPEVRMLGFHW